MRKNKVNLLSLVKRSYLLYRPYFDLSDKKRWHVVSAASILIGNVLLACFGTLIGVTTGSLIEALGLPSITYTLFLTNTLNLILAVFLYSLTSAFNSWNVNWLKNSLSQKINKNLIKKWMAKKAYYHTSTSLVTPAQIMGRETYDFNANGLDLFDNFLLVFCNFLLSAAALYILSVPLTIALLGVTFSFPGYMLFSTIAYALVYNYFLDKTAEPLKKCQATKRRSENELIEDINHIRTYAESIAFKNGSRYEKKGLLQRIKNLGFVQHGLAKTRTLLHFATTFHAQLSSVIAIILYAPNIISQNMGVSRIFESSGYFYHVVRLFTWKRDSIDRMTACDLSLKQIENFEALLFKWEKNKKKNIQLIFAGNEQPDIQVNKLTVFKPNGDPILKHFTATIPRGKITLLKGKSGAGKTTLFRSLAGLSVNAKGLIKGLPHNKHFIPSQPYFPRKKTLLEAILYPRTTPATEQEIHQIQNLMKELGFKPTTIKDLRKIKNWYGVDLSDGERKRIEIVSALFKNPDLLFMDEATTGVDRGHKLKIEKSIKSRLKSKTIIYTDHISNTKFHDRTLTMSKSLRKNVR